MFNRRQILKYSGTLAAAPAFAFSASARGVDVVPQPAALEVQQALAHELASELCDETTANKLAPYQADVGFNWTPPMVPVAQINSIVAYSFGNRPNAASGNTSSTGGNQAAFPDPGPINELLADAVYAIYSLNRVPVFAQWEIASFLVSKYGFASSTLFAVEPIINPDGSITYLSTAGVAEAIVAYVGGAKALGTVAVVGHRDHVKRCIETSVLVAMNAFAVAEVALPLIYDPLSGQSWTRNRSLYLVHDMYAQLAMQSAIVTAEVYPNG